MNTSHLTGTPAHEVKLSPAPRIDTMRNQLRNARGLLDDAARVIEALHELAYDRQAASERLGVTLSEPEGYSLDSHGDPRARAAYAQLGREVDAAAGQIIGACREALRIVGAGDVKAEDERLVIPVRVDPLDHLAAVDAQQRRNRRGEFDPGRTMTQPVRRDAERTAVRTIRRLEGEARKADRIRQREARNHEAQLRRRDRTIARLEAELTELRRGDEHAPV